MDTGNRKWGSPYLNRQFFSLVGEAMPSESCSCSRAEPVDTSPARSTSSARDALYGRNWGAIEDHPFLHFEVCYYQAIDFAIAHKLARVEAGAQGAHKIARGYVPSPTYSAHWIRDAGFRNAVARYLKEETRQVKAEIDYLAEHAPFGRKPGPTNDRHPSKGHNAALTSARYACNRLRLSGPIRSNCL